MNPKNPNAKIKTNNINIAVMIKLAIKKFFKFRLVFFETSQTIHITTFTKGIANITRIFN